MCSVVASDASTPRAPARSRTRFPAPLAFLVAASLLLGVVWCFLTPPFQAPDENSHFGYLQSLAEGRGLPGDADRPPFSREQDLAGAASNSEQTAQQPEIKPEWAREAYERWRAASAALPDAARSDGGGRNPAASNPPLYYAYEAGAYTLAARGDVFDRLTAARLASLLWLGVTVVAVWLLVGEVVGRRSLLQLAGAALAGLAPMLTFLSASVTPDSMMYALWSLVLWLGVRILKHGLTLRGALALMGLVGAACVVKSTSYGLVPPALFALAVGAWRHHPRRRRGP